MSERTEDQMYEQIDKAMESRNEHGSRWPGMSYEDGVEAALRWAMGQGEAPMEDDDDA